MNTVQGLRLRKARSPPQSQPQPQASTISLFGTPRRSRLTRDPRTNETRRRQSASIQSIQSNPVQEVGILRLGVEQAASELSLRQEIESLRTSLAQTTTNETSLKQENHQQRKRLTQAASTDFALRLEISTLKTSLARHTNNETSLKNEREKQRSLLAKAASTELSLKQELEALKGSLAQTASTELKLKEEIEVLKTTLTHALTSERNMRFSARETREDWEKVEKSLREEIVALKSGSEIVDNDVKGKRVASRVQPTAHRRVRAVKDETALKQHRKPLEGSSDIHILLDDLALQSLTKDGSDALPHAASDAFGSSILPEFTALQRATEGLQQVVNSELRAAYAKKWLTSSPGPAAQNDTSVARNLRLLVVLWEASGVEELLGSLTSIVRDATPAMDSEDCAICTDQISPAHRIEVEGCGHATCKECLREYIGAKLVEKVWPIRCPVCMAEGGPERRPRAITRALVDELVLPTTVLSQWTDLELSQFVISVTCPECEKQNLFELMEYNRSAILICNHGCECAWCRDCSRKVNIEAPHDCQDEALEALAGERRWMRCPRPSCRVMVEKNVGCDHITCRCGMHFCYRCGEDIRGRIGQHTCRQ